jgi:hypothetical protein
MVCTTAVQARGRRPNGRAYLDVKKRHPHSQDAEIYPGAVAGLPFHDHFTSFFNNTARPILALGARVKSRDMPAMHWLCAR